MSTNNVLRQLFPPWIRSFLIGLFLPCVLSAQHQPSGSVPEGRDTFTPTALDSTLRLSHQFVVQHSDTIIIKESGHILAREKDYTIDYRYGIVRFDTLFIRSQIVASSSPLQLEVVYRYLPFRFQDRYARRELVAVPGPTAKDSVKIARPTSNFAIDDIFGPNLQKSGSIVRGITIGTNRDFSVNSGLRLQLAGKLTSDVSVAASLTDENTPIQPEGTTQTLQEFDKVFVEVTGPRFNAILGDFNIDFSGTEFSRVTRKLQGATGTVEYATGFGNGSVTASGAVPRGKFQTNQIQGIEAVQGPYLLIGRNNEHPIIVLAGTERVYIDGELVARGETNDYTIDYSLGEITFTTRRLVTSASRIVVDFEYTDTPFSRSFLAGRTSTTLLDNKVDLGIAFFREADNPDEPTGFVLTDSARQALSSSGDSQQKAFISGVTKVDSNGFYVQIDSIVNGTPVSFYRYSPGVLAQYVIEFSFIGPGKGDYSKQPAGYFVWKGMGLGEYLPVKRLPMPQSHDILDYNLRARPIKDLLITGEFAQSGFDANRLSSLDDADNNGHALHFSLAYAPVHVNLLGTDIGSIDIRGKERYVQKEFVSIDRVNEIEFNRKWGIDSLAMDDEEIQEGSVTYLPLPSIQVSGGFGKFQRGDVDRSTRKDALVGITGDSLSKVNYFIEDIQSTDQGVLTSSSWLRQKGFAAYNLWHVRPTFRLESENRHLTNSATDDDQQGSFAFDALAPGVELTGLGSFGFAAEYEWRNDDMFHLPTGALSRESNSFTQSYHASLGSSSLFSSKFDLTLRRKDVTQLFESTGEADVKTVLARAQMRYTPLNRGLDTDLFYEVATERSSGVQRVFVKVTPGSGNYRYLGDLNNNGVADESEFEVVRYDGDYIATTVPTDVLVPVINLGTSLRLKLVPKLFLQGMNSWWSDVASVLSSESYLRIDEKSTEQDFKQIYLLHFSKFQQDSTTISGSTLFTEDLTLLEGRPEFSTRFRFSERTSLTNFSSALERSYSREQSIRIRSQLVREVSEQIDFVRRTDQTSNTEFMDRTHDVLSNGVIFDLSYRPEQIIEIGFKFELAASTNRTPGAMADADLNSQALRGVYSFSGFGQARVEFTREEVHGPTGQSYPYELTGGRVVGKTWLWEAALDYRVAQFVQTTVTYDGRAEAGRSIVHTGRAEVRAFF